MKHQAARLTITILFAAMPMKAQTRPTPPPAQITYEDQQRLQQQQQQPPAQITYEDQQRLQQQQQQPPAQITYEDQQRLKQQQQQPPTPQTVIIAPSRPTQPRQTPTTAPSNTRTVTPPQTQRPTVPQQPLNQPQRTNYFAAILNLAFSLICLAVTCAIGFISFRWLKGWIGLLGGNTTPEEDTTHGSARFATEKELQHWQVPAEQQLDSGALVLGPFGDHHLLVLPHEYAVRHTAIIGASGSGKSRGFFLPNCTLYEGSFLATDPKSELWKHTSGTRENAVRFAPRDPDNSAPFNFIGATVNDPHLTQLLARAIVSSTGSSKSDPFWENAETALLSSLIAHTATFEDAEGNSAATPAALYDFLTSHNGDELAAALLVSNNPIARQFANIYAQADAKVRGNVGIGLATKLTWLADPKTRRFTSSTTKTVDFGQLREEQISCYWCLAESDIAALKPLSTVFFTLALYQLKQIEGGIPVCLFLDEVANIGKLPDLETEIAVLRGRDISVVLGLQSYSQLEAIYGRDRSQVILDNCTTKIILSGTDAETAERISKMLGERTLVENKVSYNQSKDGNSTSTSTSKSARRLMFANEVREIARTEQLIITGNQKPIYWVRIHYNQAPNTADAPELGEAITANFTNIALPKTKPKRNKPLPPPMPDFIHDAGESPEVETAERLENPTHTRYTTQPLQEPTEVSKVRAVKLFDDEPTTIQPVQPINND
jgi:type IV secretion system protein VirD4